jgi:hypothetical protein
MKPMQSWMRLWVAEFETFDSHEMMEGMANGVGQRKARRKECFWDVVGLDWSAPVAFR